MASSLGFEEAGLVVIPEGQKFAIFAQVLYNREAARELSSQD